MSNQMDKWVILNLTHFEPMFHFYTPWKHQEGEVEHWLKMG